MTDFSNINPCILNFESIICMQHFLNSLQLISHVCPVFNNTNNICMQKITEFTVIFNFCFPQSVIALHCYFAVICFLTSIIWGKFQSKMFYKVCPTTSCIIQFIILTYTIFNIFLFIRWIWFYNFSSQISYPEIQTSTIKEQSSNVLHDAHFLSVHWQKLKISWIS